MTKGRSAKPTGPSDFLPTYSPTHLPSYPPTHLLPSQPPQRHRLPDLPFRPLALVARRHEAAVAALIQESLHRNPPRIGDDGLATAHERGRDGVGDERRVTVLVQHEIG